MGDSQIVNGIIIDTISNIKNAHLGDRYIVQENNNHFIMEYDGNTWNKIKPREEPTHVFVIDTSKTVILYNNNIWKNEKWFICSECRKLTIKRMRVEVDPTEYCVHCFFKINYNKPNEQLKYKLPLEQYIIKYSRGHSEEQCNHSKSCYLCDYNNKKFINDVINKEKLYGNDILNKMRNIKINLFID